MINFRTLFTAKIHLSKEIFFDKKSMSYVKAEHPFQLKLMISMLMMLLTQLSFSQSGEVVSWGQDHGGKIPNNVSAQVSATVTAIYSTDTVFFSVKRKRKYCCLG
jgi:hypothetical protein